MAGSHACHAVSSLTYSAQVASYLSGEDGGLLGENDLVEIGIWEAASSSFTILDSGHNNNLGFPLASLPTVVLHWIQAAWPAHNWHSAGARPPLG